MTQSTLERRRIIRRLVAPLTGLGLVVAAVSAQADVDVHLPHAPGGALHTVNYRGHGYDDHGWRGSRHHDNDRYDRHHRYDQRSQYRGWHGQRYADNNGWRDHDRDYRHHGRRWSHQGWVHHERRDNHGFFGHW